ncbi:hypothetical protein AQ857_15850 [Burkholderia pseudomallei]|nr:hypothetical protein BGI47_24175 [Burkholderia pseudomallei]APZ27947.1 hypothetical protein BGI46_24165 [Burkholderia pseudomallei]OMZ05913.1 hypothetical protein AQ857_15850 [Burkholderia pseudomallei]OMZ20508.1 hypothetical protein AQ858_27600 [Burkholderia pseudomallei]OMZ56123.1 hypothetical protein AQ862_09985 [Burkholderia pseudomallei]
MATPCETSSADDCDILPSASRFISVPNWSAAESSAPLIALPMAFRAFAIVLNPLAPAATA